VGKLFVLTGRDAGAEIVCRVAQGPGAQAGDRERSSKLTRLVSPGGWLIGEAAYRLTASGAAECRGPRIGLSLLALPPHSRRTMRNPHTLAKGRPQT